MYGNVPINVLGSLSYYILGGTTSISGDDDNGNVREVESYGTVEVSGDYDVGDNYIGSLTWNRPLEGLLLKTTLKRMSYDFPCRTTGQGSLPLPADISITTEVTKHIDVVYSIEYTWNELLLAVEYYKMRAYSEIFLDESD